MDLDALFTRIRFKIMAIVLMAIIPALVLIFVSSTSRKRQVAREIEANAMSFNKFLASNIQRDISEAHGFLASVVMNLDGPKALEDGCQERLTALFQKAEVYENMGIADIHGDVGCSVSPVKANLSTLPWFQDAFSHPALTVGFDFESVLSQKSALNLAYPFPDGKRVLFATMSLDWIDQVLTSARLPEGFVISVTNTSGATVARYPDPEKWRGKSLQDSSGARTSMKDGITEAKGLDGVTRIYAISAVPGEGGLVVRVGILREKVYQAVNRETYRHLVALGAIALLALLAAWFGGDVFLLKQVNTLIRVTKKLAEGDMSARTSLPYDKGELGQLAKAFDEMAESLEWRQAQLVESETERMEDGHPFKEAIEAAPVAMIILDDELRVMHVNRWGEKILGCSSTEIQGKSISDICPELPTVNGEPGKNRAASGDENAGKWTYSGPVIRQGRKVPLKFLFAKVASSKRSYWMALVSFTKTSGVDSEPAGEET